MPVMHQMQQMTWSVRVDRWLWRYKFTPGTTALAGTVTWRDPFNGRNGSGTWQIAKGVVQTQWKGSKTTEEWDLPLDSRAATGRCMMEEGTFNLKAEALDFYLAPGDVLYSGEIVRRTNYLRATIIYNDEVKTGGSVAWICNNPGNIRDGSKFGAFKDRQLNVPGAGAYAIFPDETRGFAAMGQLLRVYGRVTILQAINKWAEKSDGHNQPDAYSKSVCKEIGLSDDFYLTAMNDDQLLDMTRAMKKVEGTIVGKTWSMGDPDMPFDLRQRLALN